MKRITLSFILIFILLPAFLYAGGYHVRLQGNKQTGMGLIGAPLQFGLSSMYYNPGSLSFMKEKFGIEIGGSAIFSNVVYQAFGSNYTARTDNSMGTPFYFYAGGKANKNIAIGLAVYTPFGSAVKWDNNWALKFLIQKISLQAIYFQPTISFKLSDKLGMGAGFIFATGKVNMSKALNYGANADVNLKGSTHNYGYSVGIQYKPTKKLTIGATYRSQIKMKVKNGEAQFNVPSSLQTTIPAQNQFNADLPLPATLDFGIAYQANENLLIAAELDWVGWGTYDALSFTFKDNPQMLDNSNPRKYKNTLTPRIGAQYTVSKKLVLRAGAFYDTSPVNKDYFSPETPSLNTFAYTLGATFKPVQNLSVDLSFLQLFGAKTLVNYNPANVSGYYKSNTVVPGIGISYHF